MMNREQRVFAQYGSVYMLYKLEKKRSDKIVQDYGMGRKVGRVPRWIVKEYWKLKKETDKYIYGGEKQDG